MCSSEERRKLEEERLKRRQAEIRAARDPSLPARLRRSLRACLAAPLLRRLPLSARTLLATATVLVGVYAYYRPEFLFSR